MTHVCAFSTWGDCDGELPFLRCQAPGLHAVCALDIFSPSFTFFIESAYSGVSIARFVQCDVGQQLFRLGACTLWVPQINTQHLPQ